MFVSFLDLNFNTLKSIILVENHMESQEYYLNIATTFDEVREKFTKFQENIIQSHSDWDFQDARLVIFRKVVQMLNGFGIGFSHIHREFINSEWFKQLYGDELGNDENQKRLCREFELFLSSGIIIFLYGAIESSMRIISLKIDSVRFPKNINFSSLYKTFLADLNLEQYVNLLKIWGYLRNTIHNNGIFLPFDGQDQIIEYQGTTFKFENGKQHNVQRWEMLALLIGDFCEMVSHIIESEKVSSIKEIPDTSTIEN